MFDLISPKCLVGYDQESEELNADVLRKYLFGGHVADYMRLLQDENEEKYKTHFSQFIKAGITPDNVSSSPVPVNVNTKGYLPKLMVLCFFSVRETF